MLAIRTGVYARFTATAMHSPIHDSPLQGHIKDSLFLYVSSAHVAPALDQSLANLAMVGHRAHAPSLLPPLAPSRSHFLSLARPAPAGFWAQDTQGLDPRRDLQHQRGLGMTSCG